jgi:hypothetical protein
MDSYDWIMKKKLENITIIVEHELILLVSCIIEIYLFVLVSLELRVLCNEILELIILKKFGIINIKSLEQKKELNVNIVRIVNSGISV